MLWLSKEKSHLVDSQPAFSNAPTGPRSEFLHAGVQGLQIQIREPPDFRDTNSDLFFPKLNKLFFFDTLDAVIFIFDNPNEKNSGITDISDVSIKTKKTERRVLHIRTSSMHVVLVSSDFVFKSKSTFFWIL